MIKIDRNKCLKCGKCIRDCVVEVLKPNEDGFPFLAPELERFCLNCQHCLAVCPAGAVDCHGVTAEMCDLPGEMPTPEAMLNLLKMRRTVRHFKDENLPGEVLAALKSSLAWSATGCNDHRLFFYMVEDKQEMKFFREESSKMLKKLVRSGIMRFIYPNINRFLAAVENGEDVIFREAPHMIVAAVPKNAPCKDADPWIALSNFDLLCQSYGIGSCWCGFAQHMFRWNRIMKKHLALPKGYKSAGVMLFGLPDVSYCRATCPPECRFGGQK